MARGTAAFGDPGLDAGGALDEAWGDRKDLDASGEIVVRAMQRGAIDEAEAVAHTCTIG